MNMRQQRITTSQQEVYLIYLMDHTDFAAARIKDCEAKYEENWKQLTQLLNSTLGPKKNVDEWKMVFYNWKGQLRTRAKKLKQIQDGKTGVDDKLALQKLTDVEKRALKLWKEDFQDKDIASILNEIENKDITITPINKQNVNIKKRKASDSIIITGNTQLVAPSPTPTSYAPSVVSVPITITRTKDDNQQVDELINIKLEPFEELLTSNTQLRSSADITVQEIMDWAKTFKIPQSAVNELLQILKIKRVKTEIKSETPTKPAADQAQANSLNQRLFSKIYQRIESMERNLTNRMTLLERKVDMKNLQQLKIQSVTPNTTPK